MGDHSFLSIFFFLFFVVFVFSWARGTPKLFYWSSFDWSCFVSVHVLEPYRSTDSTVARKKLLFSVQRVLEGWFPDGTKFIKGTPCFRFTNNCIYKNIASKVVFESVKLFEWVVWQGWNFSLLLIADVFRLGRIYI